MQIDERLFKLWISAWNLVVTEKRHLETLTALLQRFVFEEHGYPRFKNWPEICKLGERDHLFMMAVATANTSRQDPDIQKIIAAFPECFSYKETAGPYPLSWIRSRGQQNGKENYDSSRGEKSPVSYDAVPKNIPLQGFDKFGNRPAGFKGPRLPDTIHPDAPQGSTVIWEGKLFVVLENNQSCEELWIAPAECIRSLI